MGVVRDKAAEVSPSLGHLAIPRGPQDFFLPHSSSEPHVGNRQHRGIDLDKPKDRDLLGPIPTSELLIDRELLLVDLDDLAVTTKHHLAALDLLLDVLVYPFFNVMKVLGHSIIPQASHHQRVCTRHPACVRQGKVDELRWLLDIELGKEPRRQAAVLAVLGTPGLGDPVSRLVRRDLRRIVVLNAGLIQSTGLLKARTRHKG